MFLDVNEVRKGRTKSGKCDIEQTTDHLAHASIPDVVWFPVPCISFNYPFFFRPNTRLPPQFSGIALAHEEKT